VILSECSACIKESRNQATDELHRNGMSRIETNREEYGAANRSDLQGDTPMNNEPKSDELQRNSIN
jgi:hypothetical protein